MARSSDSVRASSAAFAPRRRTRWQFAAAALVLLASVGWAQQVSAWDSVEALAIDPDNPTTLYAGTECAGVFKSLDGGDSWSAVNTGLPPRNPFDFWAPTVHALAIDPSTPVTLYAGADGYAVEANGVFKSVNGGSNWSAVNTGLPDYTVVYALAIDPTAPTTLYAGTPTGGVFRSVNGGSSWSAVNTGLTHPYILSLAINPTAPTTLYAGTQTGVFRSVNGGSNWSVVNTGLTDPFSALDVYALAIDPTTPATLYAATHRGVFKSVNGGSSWNAVNTGLTTIPIALAINPTTPASLYAAGDGVFRSLNGGSSWHTAGLSNIGIQAVAIDPVTPTTLYAGGGAGTNDTGPGGVVYKSTDAGTSWQETGPLGCGDGTVRCDEQCDDGGESATCDTNCTLAQCGDGTLNVTADEQCDDGNRNPFDGCTNECTVCGDGSVTSPEECDDGNTSSGDACDTQCRHLRVVGTGTPESCTETAFAAALAERSVSFNCGPAPVTIILTSEKEINAGTTIDGGGRITLSGGGAVEIFTVDASAGLEVRNLTIADGHPDREVGSAISNAGTLSVTNSTFTGKGRAISNFGTLGVTNSTFSGNSAERGGGALLNGGLATLTNCTLSENGGAILNFCDDPNDPDSLGVSPSPRGGLPHCYFGSVTLTNTIIAESTGPSCSGPITDGGHNLQFPGTSCGETIPSLDPLLDPAGLEDNGGPTQTIALLDDSPAIDAGDPDVCANPPVNAVDQRGYARPGSGHTQCSIGAYEADAVLLEVCVGDCGGGGIGSVTVDEIITLVNIALGNAQVLACPHGVPNGAEVDVVLIIQAVNAALNGCTGRSEACKQQDQMVQAAVDDTRRTPNAIVAVKNEACGVSLYASGNPTHATTASLFLLASVTKTFVATSVLSLVKEGKLGLDEPISNWIAGLDAKYDPVTVRMLLKHTGGIFGYTEDPRLYTDPNRVWEPRELVDLAMTHDPFFTPGEGFTYSNTDYILLGIVLEEVTGQKLGSVLHQHAIARAGLRHTFFLPEEPIEGQMATQFYPSGRRITNPFDPSFLWAAGSMVAPAADVVEWVWELYGSQTVLEPAQIQEMIDDSVAAELLPDFAESRYGQGVIIGTFTGTNSGPGYGHSGRWDGTSTDAYYFKDIGTAVVVLQNVQFWPPALGDEAVLIGVLNALPF